MGNWKDDVAAAVEAGYANRRALTQRQFRRRRGSVANPAPRSVVVTVQLSGILAGQFVINGLEYYIAGRQTYLHRLHTITGCLCHHGIEFLLKAALLDQYSEADLASKKQFGHSLQRLWRGFEELTQDDALAHHRSAIQRLDRFEDLRYPGWPKGKSVCVALGPRKGVKITGRPPTDDYVFILEEADELFETIFRVLPLHPTFVREYFDSRQILDVYETNNLHKLW